MKLSNQTYNGITVTLLGCMIMLFSGILPAQNLDNQHARIVFAEANQAIKAARDANADLLAPKTYSRAMANLKQTESAYLKGKDMRQVRTALRTVVSEFQAATAQAQYAILVFGNTIQARLDAQQAEAPQVAKETWDKAEAKLRNGASNLELGFEQMARSAAKEAETLFRSAEFKAVREFILAEAYSNIENARGDQAAKFAPITLQKAQDLVAQCEKELKENRQDTDISRLLAIQANREAKHALYLVRIVRKLREQKSTTEEILLASEGSLKRIANVLNLNLAYEEGFKKSTNDIVAQITELSNDNRKIQTSVFDAGQLVNLLRERNTELLSKLGKVEVEKTEIARHLEYQAMLDDKYAAVERLFSGEDVLIFREGNALRIRLTGLTFASGRSTIEAKYHRFLGKVVDAVKVFPKVSVLVEGHTDAVGTDALNMQLSLDRADNVMIYLNSRLNLDTTAIQAIGYGESRPLVTNETEEGRMKNRRIAVVILPLFE